MSGKFFSLCAVAMMLGPGVAQAEDAAPPPPPAKEAPSPPATEFLCLKKASLYGPYEGLAVACYTDRGCAFVEKLGAETLPDYDTESVAAALGREKIEGIVTSSGAIIKEIEGYGYTCRKAG
jgi:hypothetical protein